MTLSKAAQAIQLKAQAGIHKRNKAIKKHTEPSAFGKEPCRICGGRHLWKHSVLNWHYHWFHLEDGDFGDYGDQCLAQWEPKEGVEHFPQLPYTGKKVSVDMTPILKMQSERWVAFNLQWSESRDARNEAMRENWRWIFFGDK